MHVYNAKSLPRPPVKTAEKSGAKLKKARIFNEPRLFQFILSRYLAIY